MCNMHAWVDDCALEPWSIYCEFKSLAGPCRRRFLGRYLERTPRGGFVGAHNLEGLITRIA